MDHSRLGSKFEVDSNSISTTPNLGEKWRSIQHRLPASPKVHEGPGAIKYPSTEPSPSFSATATRDDRGRTNK
jgi:hypothetical protein